MSEPPVAASAELPEFYAKALELERDGIDLDRLAGELKVPEEAAEVVLELAHRKARRILANHPDPAPAD